MMFRVFVTFFCLLLLNTGVLAAQCDAVFPGPKTFAVKGSSYIINTNQCNGSYNCSPVDFTYMTNVPPLSPSGSFNSTNISDGVYQHTSWGLGSYSTVTFSGSGTAVMYFDSSVSIGQNTQINPTGSPENVLIIVNGSVVINQNAVINANIYSTGSLVIYQNSEINGAVSVAGSLYVDSNSEFNYQESYIDNMDAHGFCGNSAPVIPISCSANLPAVAFSDNFSSVASGWKNTNFNRNISNWPSDVITNSNGENTDMAFAITNGELQINGDVTASGDNEYGMISYDLALENIDKSNVTHYAIASDMTAHKSGTNNDVGLVFGYENDSNYYLARWNKYGTTYSGNNSFPGVYRRLELVKVSAGSASLLASSENFDVNDPFNFEVVVNDQGTAVCVDDTAVLYSATEQPILNDFGIFSYDNDVGVEVDNIEVRCDDCILAVPKANYRFDECSYSGADGEVIDQTGSYNAKTIGNATSITPGFIEKAIELSSSSPYIQTNVPLLSSFSVSTWFKKPTSNSGNRYFVLGAMAAGGDLLYLDRSTNWRWGVYNASNGVSRLGTFSFATLDNDWHHMVLIHANNKTLLYIDGVLKDTITVQANGTLKYIGTSYDQINATNPQGFRAPLDEFMVFDGELSQSQITQIYTHQLAKNNYDGTARAAVVCSDLIGFYTFEQTDFTTNITDTSGLDNHGINIGGASTASGKYCRAFDANGTNTSSATENAFSTGINLTDDVGTKGTISFWFNSNTSWDQGGYNGGGERTLFDTSGSNKYFTLEIQNNGRLKFAFEDSADADFSLQEPASSVRAADTWYYLSVTWDYNTDVFQILVDGVVVAQATINTNGQMTGLGAIVFGDNASSYSANNHVSLASRTSANGKFDEVRVYTTVKTAAEIQADMLDTDCVVLLNHYQILHDGSGLTCDSETVTIKACSNTFDGTCSTVNESGSFTLNVTGANGSVAKAGTFVNGVGTVNFNYIIPEQVTLALGNPSPAPAVNTVCLNGAVESCVMQFNDAEFRFLYDTNTNEKIGYQTSGDEFSKTLKIQAVKSSNGVCTGIFNGNVPVNLSQKNVTPNGTTGLPFQVNDGVVKSIAKHPSFTSNVTLNFDSNSIAVIPQPVYQDAGEIRLHASYSDSTISLVGNSNDFWVKPAKLVLSAESVGNNLNGDSATHGTTHKAGQPFDFKVSAVNRSGAVTQNYRPDNIKLNVIRQLPDITGSVNGFFSYGTGQLESSLGFTDVTLTAFDADTSNTGVSSTNAAKYSEVGVIQLDLKDSGYGDDGTGTNTGLVIDADAITVGRFTPAYFKQDVVVNGNYASSCNITPASYFAYSGQLDDATLSEGTITYLANPIIAITAFNADNVETKNYYQDSDGSPNDFMHLSASSVTITEPTLDKQKKGSDGNFLPVTTHIEAGKLEQNNLDPLSANFGQLLPRGTLHYRLSDNDHLYYQRTQYAQVMNFPMLIDLKIAKIEDSDLVAATTLNDLKDLGGVDIRYGRMTLANSYGPEIRDLPQLLTTEYFDGITFITNNDDKCTLFDKSKFLLTDIGELAPTEALGTNGVFDLGLSAGKLSIKAPGENNIGKMGGEYDAPTWLEFEWDTILGFDNPTAEATFGLFRGNDRIISWREVGN